MREGLPLAGHVLQVQSGCKGIAVHTDDLQRTHEDGGGRRLCKSCGMLRSSCLAQSACCLYFHNANTARNNRYNATVPSPAS